MTTNDMTEHLARLNVSIGALYEDHLKRKRRWANIKDLAKYLLIAVMINTMIGTAVILLCYGLSRLSIF